MCIKYREGCSNSPVLGLSDDVALVSGLLAGLASLDY